MKRRLKGSYTVEMALIFSMLFLVLISALRLTFYSYDRCVLQGIVCEAAVTAAEKERSGVLDQGELEDHFSGMSSLRFLYFPRATMRIEKCAGEKIKVYAKTEKGRMKIETVSYGTAGKPENEIRWKE